MTLLLWTLGGVILLLLIPALPSPWAQREKEISRLTEKALINQLADSTIRNVFLRLENDRLAAEVERLRPFEKKRRKPSSHPRKRKKKMSPATHIPADVILVLSQASQQHNFFSVSDRARRKIITTYAQQVDHPTLAIDQLVENCMALVDAIKIAPHQHGDPTPTA